MKHEDLVLSKEFIKVKLKTRNCEKFGKQTFQALAPSLERNHFTLTKSTSIFFLLGTSKDL